MSLENAKMGAKVRLSEYAYYLEDKYKEPKFRDLLSYAICDIDDDVTIEEIQESVEEAMEKFEALKSVCMFRADAIMALRAYADGLKVKEFYADKIISKAMEKINVSEDTDEIITIRDRYMEELRAHTNKRGPKR